jgi:hypothetical protein
VAQFCALYPQHRTVVSASPVTVGALDHVRYPDQSGEYRLTESFTARDPFQTSRGPRGVEEVSPVPVIQIGMGRLDISVLALHRWLLELLEPSGYLCSPPSAHYTGASLVGRSLRVIGQSFAVLCAVRCARK